MKARKGETRARYIARLVKSAPPLTERQRERLRALLASK